MKLVKTALFSLPLIAFATSASADSEDKKKTGATEPTPTEQPKAEETPAPPPPAPAPTVVGTTKTTVAVMPAQPQEQAEPKPEGYRVGNRTSIEPLVGTGTAHFNFGVGGRIGYTFAVPVYLGVSFMWHHGDTDQASTADTFSSARSSYYYPGGELGYDIGMAKGHVVVRPYGGAGLLFHYARASVNGIGASDTTNEFMVYPGLTVHYNIAQSPVYIGADTRLLVPVLHTNPSYQGFFVAGLSM